jgi:hypothetical protein
MSYSQNGEDDIIAAQFPADFKGTLLEVGAWEPKNLSNSRLLIERGWSAVLCEFSPVPVSKLIREYEGCSEDIKVIAAAITAEPNHVVEFQVTDDALSTNDPAQLKTWAQEGGYYGSLWVPTLSIHALLSQFFGDRRIDVASIDTEGSSVEIAIALMRTDHRPKVLCVEHNGRIVEIMHEAQAVGYKNIHTNAENVILVR